jgi:hypothetical protein
MNPRDMLGIQPKKKQIIAKALVPTDLLSDPNLVNYDEIVVFVGSEDKVKRDIVDQAMDNDLSYFVYDIVMVGGILEFHYCGKIRKPQPMVYETLIEKN